MEKMLNKILPNQIQKYIKNQPHQGNFTLLKWKKNLM